MAVFTEVSALDAASLAARLGLGELTELKGIASGIENTNYFCTTSKGRFVLTVFERLGFEQLPFYLRLMQHLARQGICVPEPQADAQGQILHTLHGKPAALVNRLEGAHLLNPGAHETAQVGQMLARMHRAGLHFPMHQEHLRGLKWWVQTAPLLQAHLNPEQLALLNDELAFQQQLALQPDFAGLPRGPIHADLFRDNVLFTGSAGQSRLSGFFDFYFAGFDVLAFDVAVCLNDWCIHLPTGVFDAPRVHAFMQAYQAERPLMPAELQLLPSVLRAAALRFWISRLWDFYLPRDAALLAPHDPRHFERILLERRQNPWSAAQLLPALP